MVNTKKEEEETKGGKIRENEGDRAAKLKYPVSPLHI